MKNMERSALIGIIIGCIVAGISILAFALFERAGEDETYSQLSPQAKALYFQQSEGLTKSVAHRLVELDQLTIGCFGPKAVLEMDSAGTNLGGQCCGALTSVEAYEEQMRALEKFLEDHDAPAFVPNDPYDVSVALAQELTAWDKRALSLENQAAYDAALERSHHGPCCCKCWKWYMMSGLAKRLIGEHGWGPEEIAQLWDLSSSCGHAEDIDLREHYH